MPWERGSQRSSRTSSSQGLQFHRMWLPARWSRPGLPVGGRGAQSCLPLSASGSCGSFWQKIQKAREAVGRCAKGSARAHTHPCLPWPRDLGGSGARGPLSSRVLRPGCRRAQRHGPGVRLHARALPVRSAARQWQVKGAGWPRTARGGLPRFGALAPQPQPTQPPTKGLALDSEPPSQAGFPPGTAWEDVEESSRSQVPSQALGKGFTGESCRVGQPWSRAREPPRWRRYRGLHQLPHTPPLVGGGAGKSQLTPPQWSRPAPLGCPQIILRPITQ